MTAVSMVAVARKVAVAMAAARLEALLEETTAEASMAVAVAQATVNTAAVPKAAAMTAVGAREVTGGEERTAAPATMVARPQGGLLEGLLVAVREVAAAVA